MNANFTIVYLMVAYAVIISIGLYTIKGRIWYKALVVAASFYIASSVYFSYDSMKGWATEETLDGKYEVIGVAVDEQKTKEDSRIYFWVLPLNKKDTSFFFLDPRRVFGYEPEGRQPRVYVIPYTDEGAKFASQSKEALRKGRRVTLDSEGSEGGSAGKSGEGKSGTGDSYMFYDGQDNVRGRIGNPHGAEQK